MRLEPSRLIWLWIASGQVGFEVRFSQASDLARVSVRLASFVGLDWIHPRDPHSAEKNLCCEHESSILVE